MQNCIAIDNINIYYPIFCCNNIQNKNDVAYIILYKVENKLNFLELDAFEQEFMDLTTTSFFFFL